MKNAQAKKNRIISILLVAALLAGLSLLLYPFVSDTWNSLHQSRAIAGYREAVEKLDDGAYERWWKAAQEYNAALPRDQTRFHPDGEEEAVYDGLLDVSGKGILGYVEIPRIGVSLPIYHGTDEEVLQIALGHVEGSSLPVGGSGAHCVISGHRGLPSARLFTNLDQLTEGDLFMLRVLDETLTYEVDQIRIVEPDDLSFLELEEGEDLCTLMTCTPYGVNSHRLLVRGRRVENGEAAAVRVTADAMLVDPRLAAPVLAAPAILVLLAGALRRSLRKQGRHRKGMNG